MYSLYHRNKQHYSKALPPIPPLAKRIHFKHIEWIEDEGGGHDANLQEAFSCWADIIPIRESNRPHIIVIGGQEEEIITHRVFCRFNKHITSQMHIHYNDRSFKIKRIINCEERNIYLEMLTQELIKNE